MTHGTPMLIGGSANQALAGRIAGHLQTPLSRAVIERFPDGELHVELLDNPRQRPVFLIQATGLIPDEHLFELLALADACRRGGAARISAVIPYFGYARQDRRARGLEPVAARLVADLITTTGVQQVITVDIHTDAIEGFFSIPMERLSAVPALAETIAGCRPENGVVVSPDLGGAKLAEKYSRLLELPTAIVRKTRIGAETVTTSGLTGEVRGRTPIIVDDMISTGGTIEAAVSAVLAAGANPEGLIVAATHGLFVGSSVSRLKALPIKHLFVTDSLAFGPVEGLTIEVVSIGSILAESIQSLIDQEEIAPPRGAVG